MHRNNSLVSLSNLTKLIALNKILYICQNTSFSLWAMHGDVALSLRKEIGSMAWSNGTCCYCTRTSTFDILWHSMLFHTAKGQTPALRSLVWRLPSVLLKDDSAQVEDLHRLAARCNMWAVLRLPHKNASTVWRNIYLQDTMYRMFFRNIMNLPHDEYPTTHAMSYFWAWHVLSVLYNNATLQCWMQLVVDLQ